MKDITHIARPNLPWRTENLTECGLDASRHPTWTREEALAEAKEMGRQRFSLFACMTCTPMYGRYATWEQDPASCLSRFCDKFSLRYREPSPEREQFANELRAIAILIESHRDEFDGLVDAVGTTESLADRRAAKSRRRA